MVLSMIPRNEFRDGKVIRADNDYGKWAQEVAQQEGAIFIDMNHITADKYDQWGPDSVKKFFPGDHTHTNKRRHCECRICSRRHPGRSENPLNKYLKN
jgi:rhamnogalacturonan acetylesterase